MLEKEGRKKSYDDDYNKSKKDIQNDLDEARQRIEQMSVEQENVQRLLNEAQIENANIIELLSDADAAIERYKQERENEVLKITSRDIQLTGTELGETHSRPALIELHVTVGWDRPARLGKV